VGPGKGGGGPGNLQQKSGAASSAAEAHVGGAGVRILKEKGHRETEERGAQRRKIDQVLGKPREGLKASGPGLEQIRDP